MRNAAVRVVVGFMVAAVAALHAEPVLEFDKADNFAKNRRVAVVNFAVEYQTKLVKTASRFGSTSSSTTEFSLLGVTKAAMEKDTEKMYQQFLKDLAASGVEVVPLDEIKKHEEYAKLKRSAETMHDVSFTYNKSKGWSKSEAVVCSPAALPYHTESAGEVAGRFVGFDTGQEGMSEVFANRGPHKDIEADLANSLNATLLKVYYVVGFGDAKASVSDGAGYIGHGQSVTSELYLATDDTRFALRVPDTSSFHWSNDSSPSQDGNAFIRLKERVSAGAGFAVETPSNANTTDTNVGNALSMLGNVASNLMGSTFGGTANKQEFKVSADEKTYLQLADKLIDETQKSMIARLKAGQ